MSWKTRTLEAMAGIIFVALPAYPQARERARDERILSFVHQANLQEIAEAKLAKAKSSSQGVKDFADQMVTDHQGADERVRAYARDHGVDLDSLQRRLKMRSDERLERERQSRALGTATGEWAFTWEQAIRSKDDDEQTLELLRKLDGTAFDREFVRAMVDGHQKVIDGLNDVRDRSIDPDLRKLIDELLPTIKHHLEMAQALHNVVSKA